MPNNLVLIPVDQSERCAADSSSGRSSRVAVERAVEVALLLIASVFLVLHFVHLRADFPNHSPWMDWAKYTDEGWYGDAAIRHYELGHWNLPGDFNPAAALPVWPALEMALFRFTGVSLPAARALTVTVFGLILGSCYLLIRRWMPEFTKANADGVGRLSMAPAIAVVLLAVSPFCFVFSRLAILEPLLILLTLAALMAASFAGEASALACNLTGEGGRLFSKARLRSRIWIVGLGLLLPLMVLTKTTAVFLFPAIFWMLWAAGGFRTRQFAGAAALACGVSVTVWGGYYLLFVRPHYLIDYRYLFSANGYTGITLATFWPVLHDAVLDISWIGETLFVLAMFAVVVSVASVAIRRRRANPLMVALLLWVFGYGAFLAYHANLQPRYYLVIAFPLIMLTAMVFDVMLARAFEPGEDSRQWLVRGAALGFAIGLTVAAFLGVRQTLSYVEHPEYGWWSAAQQVRELVDREAHESQAKGGVAHSRLVLSISGSEISLMTGLESICDDFGTMTLAERAATYRPGWYVAWNDVEDDKMEALAPLYRLVRVAAIPAFDDPDRNLLIVYRLDPLSSPGVRGGSGRRRFLSVPRRLRTKVGEQPSAAQLRH